MILLKSIEHDYKDIKSLSLTSNVMLGSSQEGMRL